MSEPLGLTGMGGTPPTSAKGTGVEPTGVNNGASRAAATPSARPVADAAFPGGADPPPPPAKWWCLCCIGSGDGLACTGRTDVLLGSGPLRPAAAAVLLLRRCGGRPGMPRIFRALPSTAAGMPSPASSPSCTWLCFCGKRRRGGCQRYVRKEHKSCWTIEVDLFSTAK